VEGIPKYKKLKPGFGVIPIYLKNYIKLLYVLNIKKLIAF
jgi:hypothetical protein